MKRRLKIAVGCAVTAVLTALIVLGAGFLVRPVDTDRAVRAIEAFHALPENTAEVIVYGSSHAWKGVDTVTMYERYGIEAYNYGCNWQKLNTTALFLQDSLRTQSPRVALIETYCVNQLLTDTDLNGEIYYTRALPDSPARRRYLEQCFAGDLERYVSYYLPLAAFHDNWVNWEKRSFVPASAGRYPFAATRGYERMDGVTPVTVGDWREFSQREIDAEPLAVLDEMVSTCRDRGIEVVLFTVPWAGQNRYRDALSRYAADNGCAYLDLFERMEEIGLDTATDFHDKGHLNYNGAVKVGDYLGAYLAEHYALTDGRAA